MSKKNAIWTLYLARKVADKTPLIPGTDKTGAPGETMEVQKFKEKQTLNDTIQMAKDLSQRVGNEPALKQLLSGKLDPKKTIQTSAGRLPMGLDMHWTDVKDVKSNVNSVVFSVFPNVQEDFFVGPDVLYVRVRDEKGYVVPSKNNRGLRVSRGEKLANKQIQKAFRRAGKAARERKVFKCRMSEVNVRRRMSEEGNAKMCKWGKRDPGLDKEEGTCTQQNKQCLVSAVRSVTGNLVTAKDWATIWQNVAKYS